MALIVSIRALREEGDRRMEKMMAYGEVSIRALREEGDPPLNRDPLFGRSFNPRPP